MSPTEATELCHYSGCSVASSSFFTPLLSSFLLLLLPPLPLPHHSAAAPSRRSTDWMNSRYSSFSDWLVTPVLLPAPTNRERPKKLRRRRTADAKERRRWLNSDSSPNPPLSLSFFLSSTHASLPPWSVCGGRRVAEEHCCSWRCCVAAACPPPAPSHAIWTASSRSCCQPGLPSASSRRRSGTARWRWNIR